MKEGGKGLIRGKYLVLSCMVLWSSCLLGQAIRGIVVASNNSPVPYGNIVWSTPSAAGVVSGADDGTFLIESEEYPLDLTVSAVGYMTAEILVDGPSDSALVIVLSELAVTVDQALVESERGPTEWLPSLSNGGLYRGMKSLAIQPEASLAVPGEVQARNVFSAIPGANIWESDAAGLQLGIGVRGLSPNRSAYLSIRQDGVPIAAVHTTPSGESKADYMQAVLAEGERAVFVDDSAGEVGEPRVRSDPRIFRVLFTRS